MLSKWRITGPRGSHRSCTPQAAMSTRHTPLKWPQTFVTTRHWAQHRANSTTPQSALTHAISKIVNVLYNSSFLGAFAELRRATISFVMSVRPHGTTRLPLDGFSSNLISEYFSNSVYNIQESLKWGGGEITIRESQYKCSITPLSFLLRMKNVSDKSCRETQNTFYAQ